MALRQKRNRRPRLSTGYPQPLAENPENGAVPHGKITVRFLMTLIFLAGAIVVLNFPVSTPRLRVGQIAKKDYRARVPLQVPDEEATRGERRTAEERTMRVFQENIDHLAHLSGELRRFLNQAANTRETDEVRRLAREQWGLAPTQIATLRRHLKRTWIHAGIEALKDALVKAKEKGIIRTANKDTEEAADRFYIKMRPWNFAVTPKEVPIPIFRTIAHPEGVREFFESNLEIWLRDKPDEFREILLDMLVHAAKPTLTRNEEATAKAIKRARESVPQQYREILKGTIILAVGESVTERALEEIEIEARGFAGMAPGIASRDETEWAQVARQALRMLGVSGIFLLGFVLLALYGEHFAADELRSNTRIFGAYAMSLFTLIALRLIEQFGITPHLTPVTLAAMIVMIAAGPMLAFGVTVVLALVAGIANGAGVALSLPLLTSGAVAVLALRKIQRRTVPFNAGAIAGLVYAATVWGLHLAQVTSAQIIADWPIADSVAGFLGCIAAGSILTASLPYAERFFDVATDLRLLEWTNQNQPLLRRLAMDAPGTCHHSTVVSHMAEAAAKAVDANALLARAAAYLHDVGKLTRPDYFVENALGRPSRHDRLTPMMSTLVLTAHTHDGSEIARQYGVPRPIRRVIEEHHGTCVVLYFHQKAFDEAKESGAEVHEDMFRYRGPKPTSPESAIVMLSDAAESAARSMNNTSPSRLKQLVHELVNERLNDGQFDESRMTITDVRRVEASLVRSLTAVSHPRIRYPNIREEEDD